MSDNYKVIRQTREAVKDLRSQGWATNKIAKEIGCSGTIIQDMLDGVDEVAMNLRTPTVEKFRVFLKRRNKVEKFLEKPPSKIPEPEKIVFPEDEGKPSEPIKQDPDPETEDRQFPWGGGDVHFWPHNQEKAAMKWSHIAYCESVVGLLDLLNIVGEKLEQKGYRLDASITMIHKHQPKPVEDEK